MNALIRIATPPDLDQMRQLFYDTITTVNTKDYTPEQIEVWSSGYHNIDRWQTRLREQYVFLAVDGDTILGMTSLRSDGYLDLMYVHRDHQGKGIATMLLHKLEAKARKLQLKEIFADVSITARPFFLHHGYSIREQTIKVIKDIAFDNAVMQKVLA